MSETEKNVSVDAGVDPLAQEEDPALDTSPVVEEVRGNRTAVSLMKEQVKEFRGKGEVKVPLEKPLRSGIKEIKTLRLNFNQLTPMDILNAETRWATEFGGGANVSPSHSTAYRLLIASIVAGVPIEDFLHPETGLSYRDTIGISSVVLVFLMQLD